jgi:hypothetical protein
LLFCHSIGNRHGELREGIGYYYFCSTGVNGTSAVCDQKISKFFESHWEESMAGHMGVNGVY